MKLMGQGILLTIIGMGTVFIALGVLAALVRLIEGLVERWEGAGAFKTAKAAVQPPVERTEHSGPEDLIPVIAAAVGAYLEAEAARVFLIPVERPDRSRWVVEGRVAALSRREGL